MKRLFTNGALGGLTVAALVALAPAAAQAQSCGGDFSAWKAQLRQEAVSAGVGQRGLTALDQATTDPRTLRADRAQGVFTQDFTEFAGRMINNYRLQHGKANLQKYASIFDQAEQRFGVPGPVISAFWALETDFGAVQGDFDTLNSLVTLAHDCRRPQIFRPQIVPLLKLIDRGDVPMHVQGAWAGEIGQTQMLPADILELGIDGDGDGHVDMKSDVADVIMTTAHNLSNLGWRPGEPWMQEVSVPDEMPWGQTGIDEKLPISQYAAWGVKNRDGSPLDTGNPPAGLALPMGRKGAAFLVYPNYDVYLKWNQSFVYTLTAANLATRFAGAPKFDPGHPEEGLASEAVKVLQQKLVARGYDVGGIDGIMGSLTRDAVRAEQKRLGYPADGWPTPALLANL